jgi:hypothetical protein
LTGDEKFLEASLSAWEFIKNYIIDKHFWQTDFYKNPFLFPLFTGNRKGFSDL